MNITQFGKKAADKLATATNNGLLAAADYTKLGRLLYGPSGELILPPNGVAAQDYLWRDTTARAHLHNNSELFLEANGALYLCANTFYNSVGASWNRIDTSKAAFLLVLRPDPTGQLEFYSAAAGANPIAWTGPTSISRTEAARLVSLLTITSVVAPLSVSAGALSIPAAHGSGPATDGYMLAADKALLDAATDAATASTLAKRDANGSLSAFAWNAINAAGGAAPAFSTNWSNLAGYNAVQYRKGTDKTIHLRGNCTKSIAVVAAETLFTLPTGFRPPAQLSFAIASFNGTTPVVTGITITTGGVVQLYGGHQGHVSFSGVYFYTD